MQNARCVVIVVVPDHEFATYLASGFRQRFKGRVTCMTQNQFKVLPCTPAVTVSLHPELGSEIARRFASKGTQRIVMQHGLSDKVVFSDRERADPLADFDVVFLIGPVYKEGSLSAYCKKYPDTCRRLRFMEIGSPKTDALFKGEIKREAVLKELGLDPARPTVCYAPTWERWASLEQHGMEIMETLASLNINVIVKLHHLSLCTHDYDWLIRDGHGGKDWHELVKQQESRFANLRLAPGQDATPYLVASDLLISDASGVAYEFVLQNKPVIFFDVPELFEVYGTNGIHYWARTCGDVVSDMESLRETVILNLREPSRKSEERLKWIPRISYSRGDATRKAGEAIVALAQQPR
jgi:hypothetical protein